ncbi:DgyrCDS1075 [Dimorphilus gyrociliatus]|uniref:DgyrCDS1075 n=1 Tax=Dimorphilus gyrociliatus TaxID=2664684 RepID=A0A7I8V7M7_9ANNE|nr:DgyrCDS1075 [Dimorphilus gyrociliatus]
MIHESYGVSCYSNLRHLSLGLKTNALKCIIDANCRVVAVTIGAVAFFVAIVGLTLLIMKRCSPGCRYLKTNNRNDTQILVIEGPDGSDDSDFDSP